MRWGFEDRYLSFVAALDRSVLGSDRPLGTFQTNVLGLG